MGIPFLKRSLRQFHAALKNFSRSYGFGFHGNLAKPLKWSGGKVFVVRLLKEDGQNRVEIVVNNVKIRNVFSVSFYANRPDNNISEISDVFIDVVKKYVKKIKYKKKQFNKITGEWIEE
jgi:hypothetical protein